MWHIGLAEQQPGNGATDHGEPASEGDQHRFDGDRGAVAPRLYFSSTCQVCRSLPFAAAVPSRDDWAVQNRSVPVRSHRRTDLLGRAATFLPLFASFNTSAPGPSA